MEGRDKQRREEECRAQRVGSNQHFFLASIKSHSGTKNEMKKRGKAVVDLRGKETRRYVEDKKATDGSHSTL